MFLMDIFPIKKSRASIDSTRMLRFCEARNECSFYFLASLVKNLLVKTVFSSYFLKLGLLTFLNVS